MQTLRKFLVDSKVVGMRCREVDPDRYKELVIPEPWAAKQYRCELHGTNGDRPITTIVGSDNGPPEMPEVLDAVAAESAIVDGAGCFEIWAVQMGFDPDSRYGERIYRAWRRQARCMRKLLGEEQYERLLWDTKRL